jgi:hypothetical protein
VVDVDDEFVESEVRKDGKLSLTFNVHDEGLTGTSAKGADIEMSGTAQIVLNRDEALRLFSVVFRYILVVSR